VASCSVASSSLTRFRVNPFPSVRDDLCHNGQVVASETRGLLPVVTLLVEPGDRDVVLGGLVGFISGGGSSPLSRTYQQRTHGAYHEAVQFDLCGLSDGLSHPILR
jgi:hypothetical protein